ncbi:hypothetical protein PFISCL1PPCAC_8231 [Pristionchus fissidentatus]|uniref:C-type lectin domain-containing protein n=1 Tax=Pristionchus fissidentatus TaxID=1538716 RepID=A0AAV5VEQ2_9BILA|nr:hypothetical protein PFISCL1PPCAC_8231 [Pristionchus fissidentatus]
MRIIATVCLSFFLLFSSTNGTPCPNGYTQFNGGDCFKTVRFMAFPETANQAEMACGDGGLLASIHNKEENDMVPKMACTDYPPETVFEKILGLRCWGKDCEWDDGSEVDYINFFPGYELMDDGVQRCFDLNDNGGHWYPRNDHCSSQKGCWLCRVKAKTFDCLDGETEYKGGCVSVHSTPVNQTTAESSCPDGGHLVSVHSGDENAFYQRLASSSGISGSFYLGGFSTDGEEWIDQTHFNFWNFAKNFPNSVFGDCIQMMLSTEFGNQGQWTNIDCLTKLPYLCFRDGRTPTIPTTTTKLPTTTVQKPLANPKCDPIQTFEHSGVVYSPNYPFSIPAKQTCEYLLGTDRGTQASVKFSSYNCTSGTKLSLFDSLDSTEPFATFTFTPPSSSRVYSATSNVLKMSFEASYPVGNGWQADFFGL